MRLCKPTLREELPEKAAYIDNGTMFNQYSPRYEIICQSFDKHGEFACLHCTEFLGRMEYPFHCRVWRDHFTFTQPFMSWIRNAHQITGKWAFSEEDLRKKSVQEQKQEEKNIPVKEEKNNKNNILLFRRV